MREKGEKAEEREAVKEVETTAVATRVLTDVGLPVSGDPVSNLRAQIAIVKKVYNELMKKGVHYGEIPGTHKPSLLKPGAEKLVSTFRMAPSYIEKKEWLSGGHVNFDFVCKLHTIKTRDFLGEGVGCCSTLESKYRFRWQSAGPADEQYWANRYTPAYKDIKHRQGRNGYYLVKKVENENIADQYNTVKKIGKKRSLVDAVLTVTGVSDIFTQDAEDFNNDVPPAEGTPDQNQPPANQKAPPRQERRQKSGNQFIPPQPSTPAPSQRSNGRLTNPPRGKIAKDPAHLERVGLLIQMANDRNIDARTLLLCLADSGHSIPSYVKDINQFRYLYDAELDELDAYINEGEIKTGTPESVPQPQEAATPPSTPVPGPAPTTEQLKVESTSFKDDDVPPSEKSAKPAGA